MPAIPSMIGPGLSLLRHCLHPTLRYFESHHQRRRKCPRSAKKLG